MGKPDTLDIQHGAFSGYVWYFPLMVDADFA